MGYDPGMTRRQRAAMRDRLELTLEMQQLGLEMMHLTLRRRYPRATATQLRAKLAAWLLARPLDAPGRVGRWPRAPRR